MEARIIIGNNLETLKQLSDKSVQTCVTSPPYWGLRDYGTKNWTGGDAGCKHIKDTSKTKKFGNHDFNQNRPSREATKLPGYYFEGECLDCGAIEQDLQLGLEPKPDDFVENLCKVFDEVWRVLRDDGTLWLNLGDTYSAQRWTGSGKGQAMNKNKDGHRDINPIKDSGLPDKNLVGIPWKVAFALQARGWYLRQDIIWHKPNPMPESVTDRCTKAHEYIFLLTKKPKYYYDYEAIKEQASSNSGWASQRAKGESNFRKKIDSFDKNSGNGSGYGDYTDNGLRNKRSVWSVNVRPYKEAHFATYPPELIGPCILAGSKEGDLVLDPFSGSGTTGEVAIKNNRNYIGLELNPEYAAISERRLEKAMGMLGQVIVS